jgi:hypothetical protein
MVNHVERELRRGARTDPDGCFGYYPEVAGATVDLPGCQAFAEALQVIEIDGQQFQFDWVKFSRGCLERAEKWHLDTSRASGLGEGELDDHLVPTARIDRVLLNFHAADRYLSWLNVDAHAVDWQQQDGFVTLAAPEQLKAEDKRTLVIPRRAGQLVSAALINVSQVGHGAREMPQGHFLASWSREAAA